MPSAPKLELNTVSVYRKSLYLCCLRRIDNSYQIKYSHLGGRHVKEHIALFTAKRAIGLIENLRDTKSQKERVEMIKASKGMTTRRYKHNLVTVPLHDRISLTCKVCESLSVYDKQKPKSEYRCPGCGSEEISEG